MIGKQLQRRGTNWVSLSLGALISPEQCRGRADVDSRADVYSLGVMLYEMLCGEPPFQAKGTGELLAMHIVETPPPLLSRAPATPRPLAELVEQMLHKEKDRRPSMQQIIEALESMMPLVGLTPRSPSLSSTGDQLKLPPVSAALPETATTLLKSSGQRAPLLRLKESRSLLLIAGLGITVVIASYALRGRPETPAGLPASHPAAAVPRTVRWSITTEPDGAEIYSERQLAILGATPWQSEQAAKHGVERLRVRRAGFRDILLELNMDSDEQRRLTLVPLRTVPRPKLSPKAPPKAPAPVKKPPKSNAKRIEVED